ncbi:prolyl 4-hydroxylase subunit alpha-1-like [Bactrocera tryoni]|uniref:prolyl 4-hydroxylase subunit alpha-1-like n=1 Tax=Bactrocera tryoni TaxID=59916 RepID=UPI001A9743ED|nr:prolyl 4-hydroxylase subunit alpha-1-like [Bactrocera tryoni]
MTSQAQLQIVTKRKLNLNGKIGKTLHCHLAAIFIALWTVTCQAEYFSSIDSIPALAIAEEDLIEWYRNFLDTQEQDFAVYRNFIERVKEEHELALEDPEAYLGNPINAYKLIKRTVVDWATIAGNVRNSTALQALKANLTSLTAAMSLPDISELRGAAKGLGRLQTMYNLKTPDLADGVINGVYYGSELSAYECFEIGSNLFEAKEYPLAKEWLQLVLNLIYEGDTARFKTSGDFDGDFDGDVDGEEITEPEANAVSGIEDTIQQTKEALDTEICRNCAEYDDEYDNEGVGDDDDDDDDEDDGMEDLIYEPRYGVFAPVVLYDWDKNGNIINQTDIERSDNLKNETSAIDPDSVANKLLNETLEYLALTSLELGERKEMKIYINEILDINPEHAFKDLLLFMNAKETQNRAAFDSLIDLQRYEWFANYSRLCQGEQVEQKERHQLKCKLDTHNHPLFILAPLQKEELHADPEIIMYHGLLSDKHIDDVLEQSEAHMVRSRVGGVDEYTVRDVRVSQQTWLTYHSPTLKYIHRTVSAISGFDLSNAEDMQVANYGIGGQYDPHHDFFDNFDHKAKSPWIGNRIATHLFFASDVEQGGYTVFPLLNVYAKPVKGSMVMWRNLHKSLDPDRRTLHAGCPVVKGTKRICNIWVRSGYQEFSHPCGLVRDNYKSAHVK